MKLDNVYSYDGQHSFTFTKGLVSKNTWTDWGLIPSSRHSEPLSAIWNQAVSTSGVNGEEDLIRLFPFSAVNNYYNLRSELIVDNRDSILENYGYDIFQPKSGSLSFIIADQTVSFFVKSQEIANFLHNQEVLMVPSDDPSTVYTVRTTVDSFDSGTNFSSLSISYSILNEASK